MMSGMLYHPCWVRLSTAGPASGIRIGGAGHYKVRGLFVLARTLPTSERDNIPRQGIIGNRGHILRNLPWPFKIPFIKHSGRLCRIPTQIYSLTNYCLNAVACIQILNDIFRFQQSREIFCQLTVCCHTSRVTL